MSRPTTHALRLVLACLPCLTTAEATAQQQQSACFTAADNQRLRFQVIQQAPPPAPGRPYNYYPLTGVATMQLGTLQGPRAGFDRYYFQWANRSNTELRNQAGRVLPRKLNIQPTLGAASGQRTGFSSIDRANACTLAQTATVLGLSSQAQGFARDAGITLIGAAAQAGTSPVGATDACITAAATLPRDATGILLDYEVQDGRSDQQTTAFLKRFTDLVHGAGRKAILLIDPFDAPSQRYGGISAVNANRIVAMFDLTTLMLWGHNVQHDLAASYRAQMAMIRSGGAVDPARIVIDFDLAGNSLADARFVRDTILRDRLAGVLLWRNRAQQGGNCDSPVNASIAAIAFGGPAGH